MDILNFISWIASKRRVVTSAPDDALVPIGIRTETRDDKYTTVAIKKSDLISSGFKYEIGEYVEDEGGVIFYRYLDGSTQNYLVVSITDQSTGQAWSNVTSTPIGSNAQSTWDGLSNSNAIIGQSGFTNGAALTCLNYSIGSIDDWYLPALDELSLLWQNRFNVNKSLESIVGATQILVNNYWSSTENAINSLSAWGFLFGGGNASSSFKNNITFYVRAVRKFSI